ncbi:MAG: DUF1800 domain-containing protein [Rhizobiaceae bacterium]|nr:DUF1800 domain-containing protein [Rhizobiaceae bacterium]
MSLSFQTMSMLRFGYGFRSGEAPPTDKQALLGQVTVGALQIPLFPIGGVDARRQRVIEVAARFRDIYKGSDGPDVKRARQKAISEKLTTGYQRDADARLAQAVYSPNGFYERLASFWVNHFSVSTRKNQQMPAVVPLYEAEAIRPNVGAKFSVLLRAATSHPAMLLYLDQSQSFGPDSAVGVKNGKGLNENLGRELLELHTLGAGSGYTQDDVRSTAMVLTGLTFDPASMKARFRPGVAEPGSHQVLGVSYGGAKRSDRDYLSLLDNLAANPRTAKHICRKLVVHFISDQPPQEMIDAMVGAWISTDGNLMAVYAAMLDHPAAWADFGSKARQPFDYVVAGLRAMNVDRNQLAGQSDELAAIGTPGSPDMADDPVSTLAADDPATLDPETRKKRNAAFDASLYFPRDVGLAPVRRMGQPIWQPPSPAGFPEDFVSWVNSSQLAERLAWAHRVAARYGKLYDPRRFLKDTLADAARDDTIRVVSQAPNKVTGLTLVLASPEFYRR